MSQIKLTSSLIILMLMNILNTIKKFKKERTKKKIIMIRKSPNG